MKPSDNASSPRPYMPQGQPQPGSQAYLPQYPQTQPQQFATPAPIPAPDPLYTGYGQPAAQQPYNGYPAPSPQRPFPERRSHKKLYFAIGATVAVLALVGGGVFGLYLPSRPESIYKTGISRTGMVLDKLTQDSSTKNRLAAYSSSTLSGSLEVSAGGKKYTGTISSQYGQKQSDTSINYIDTAANKKLALQLMTDLPDGKAYPDLYLKYSGLSGLGLDDSLPPALLQYDGKWILASSEYLSSIVPADSSTDSDTQSDFQASDAAEMARAAADTTRDYVFSNQPDKAVLVMKRFIGSEKVEGIQANHYEVGINKTNAITYCKALVGAVMATDGYKKVPGVDATKIADEMKSAQKECGKADIKSSDTFGMWVDTHNKLIHKVRFTDDTAKDTYAEFGQNYTKGSVIPLFATWHDGPNKTDGTATLRMDSVSNETAGTASYTSGGTSAYSVKASFDLKPLQTAPKITKPTSSVPVQDVLQALGIDPSALTGVGSPTDSGSVNGGIQSKAKDSERQTDLRSLQSQLEAYFAQNDSYPTLANLNSASWRAVHMKGLDPTALQDPNGASSTLTTAATATQYGYAPSVCNDTGTNCQSYTLSAVLSDGSSYTVDSLN